jgi:hypothetical protein
MKKLVFLFLCVANMSWGTEKTAAPLELHALSGFESFEIITVFSPYTTIHQKAAHNLCLNLVQSLAR